MASPAHLRASTSLYPPSTNSTKASSDLGPLYGYTVCPSGAT